ncbi:hypothetical protein FACS189468_0640 [Spirochaetia bacterium]|nr:hypothetical protein FACS189468_0640 [Spirochaetia bacterium]
MKKNKFSVLGMLSMVLTFGLVLAGCGTVVNYTKMSGEFPIPLEYFQKVKNEGERLVLISPILAPNHLQSLLYIISNPEDIQKALDTLGDSGDMRPWDIEKAVKAFSPVNIVSRHQSPAKRFTYAPDMSDPIEDGIAIFSVPPSVDQFFYAYMIAKEDYKWGSNDPAEVWIGTIPLPPGSQDVYITFSEEEGDIVVSADANPEAIKNSFEATTGLYGALLGKKHQAGFIPLGFKESSAYASEQAKAKRLAAGATFHVNSNYFTYRQETRSREVPVVKYEGDETETWTVQERTGAYAKKDIATIAITKKGRGSYTETETRTEAVTIPIHHELAFELYKGDVRVYRGRTPAELTGIELDTEYTLRWVSPVDGNRSYGFKMGLNFLGYPGDGWYTIK